MIKTSRAAANLFTGNEEPGRLSEKQMVALLLFSWPEKHTGPAGKKSTTFKSVSVIH